MRRAAVLFVLMFAAAGSAAKNGRALFEKHCANCHAAAVERDPVAIGSTSAPTLAYAGNKFRRDWIASWLTAPSPIRPAGYLSFRWVVTSSEGDHVDVAAIPSHPRLEKGDAANVADYLATLRRPSEDYPRGQSNGRGEVHFSKLLPCAGCHRTAPERGGVSAPELYTAAQRLQPEWIGAFVFDPPAWSPSLMPKLPLKSDQLAALVDFIASLPAPASSPRIAPVAAGNAHVTLDSSRPRALYQIYCTQCHGMKGDGRGIDAPSLFISPRDHTSADEMRMLTDDRLFAAIKYGGTAVGKSALMPSWNGTIDDADIRLLVGYLRALSGTGSSESAGGSR